MAVAEQNPQDEDDIASELSADGHEEDGDALTHYTCNSITPISQNWPMQDSSIGIGIPGLSHAAHSSRRSSPFSD
ncbi:hypothetical protein ACFQH8_21570 [Halomicroarcula sp. GCM10025710]